MSAGTDDKHEDRPAKVSHRRGSRVEDRDRTRYTVGPEGELMEQMQPDERCVEGPRIARSRRSVRTALENEIEEDGETPLPPLRPARRVARSDVLIDSDRASPLPEAQEDLVIIRRDKPRDRRRRKYCDDVAFQDAQTDVSKPKKKRKDSDDIALQEAPTQTAKPKKKRKESRKQLQCQGEEPVMQHESEREAPLPEKGKKEKRKKRTNREDDDAPHEPQPVSNDNTNVPRPTVPVGPGMSGHQMFQPHMMGRPPVFSHIMSSLMRPMFGMMPNGLMMMRPGMGHPVGHPAINASMMPGNMAMNLPGQHGNMVSATGCADNRDGLPRKSKAGREPSSISDAAATLVSPSRSCSSSASSSSSTSSSQPEQDVTGSVAENVEMDLVPPAAGSPATISKVQDCMNSPIPLDAQGDDESKAVTASAGEVNDGSGQSIPLAAPPGIESPPLFGVTASEGEPAVAVGAQEGGDAQGSLLLPSAQQPRNAGWHEVQTSRSIEDLRLELEVASSKEGASIATQTDGDPTNVPEECFDYWFAGFAFPMAAPGPIGSPKAVQDQEAEDGRSAPSSPVASHEGDVVQGEEGTCRPERHIRRRPMGSRSRSPGNVIEPVAAQAATGSEQKRSSSASSQGSSSSSSGFSGRRQRATSSEGEGPTPALAAPPALVTGSAPASASIPPSLRAIPDYSDVM